MYRCGFYRHDERTDEGSGWKVDLADQQEVSYRVLHCRTLEEREIVEEKLLYDLVGLLKQIGVM